MARYLLTQTDVYAVDDLNDVDALKEELLNDTHFTLAAFGYKTKPIKEKKEIVGEYHLVTAKKVYLNEKELFA